MMALFERTGLEQDTGLLKERWNQEGSDVVSASDSQVGNGSTTLHTVTTGKVLYVKNLSFYAGMGGAAPDTAEIKDGTTVKLALAAAADEEPYNFSFPAPVKFTTSFILSHASAGSTWTATFVGWEENA